MNTNIIKGLVIFATGVGIGALVANKLLKNKYETLVQEEIDSVKASFQKRVVDKYEEDKKKHDLIDYNNEKKSLIYRKTLNKYNTYDELKDDIDPAELETPPEGDEDDDEPEEDEPEEDEPDDGEDDDEYSEDEEISMELLNRRDHITPYVITSEEFSEEKDYYDKLSIYYYNEDDTLADDQEEIIPDVASIIGNDALHCFGKGSHDPEVVFVRNERLASDFEVLRMQQSYQETVVGIIPDRPRGGMLRGED